MSTLTTIQSTDLITNSRADINNNFSALNTDKIETSVLDTDTALTANSDAKIPSQKAVKAYVDAGGQANASTTVKGIVEIATQAEVNAGTTTGATGATLVVEPSTLAARLSSSINFGDGSDGDVTISTPTTLTRDMFYNNLVVTDTLNTDGYRVFVKGTLSGTGTIANNNTSAGGSPGASASAGGAGTAKGSGIWKGVAGVAGGAGGTASASNGVTGLSGNKGSAGAAGGNGGNVYTGAAGGTAGTAGTNDTTKPIYDKYSALHFAYYSAAATLAQYALVGGGGGGGGGGRNTFYSGGGGGGSGGSGGVILLFAKSWAGNFTISATGANGGNGGTGPSGEGSGGGGGGGGAGGVVVVVYGTKTWTGSYTLTGGTGGTGGAAGSGGGSISAGTAGSNGTTGVYYEYDILSLL